MTSSDLYSGSSENLCHVTVELGDLHSFQDHGKGLNVMSANSHYVYVHKLYTLRDFNNIYSHLGLYINLVVRFIHIYSDPQMLYVILMYK